MNKILYRVMHPFGDHKLGDTLTEVDEARLHSNHVVPISDEGDGSTLAKESKQAVAPKEAEYPTAMEMKK